MGVLESLPGTGIPRAPNGNPEEEALQHLSSAQARYSYITSLHSPQSTQHAFRACMRRSASTGSLHVRMQSSGKSGKGLFLLYACLLGGGSRLTDILLDRRASKTAHGKTKAMAEMLAAPLPDPHTT